MPAELLSKGKLTTATDVYSFGMLMWELIKSCRVLQGVSMGQVRPCFPASVLLLHCQACRCVNPPLQCLASLCCLAVALHHDPVLMRCPHPSAAGLMCSGLCALHSKACAPTYSWVIACFVNVQVFYSIVYQGYR